MSVIEEPDKVSAVLMWAAMAMTIPLGIVLAQPAWRGAEMARQIKEDCTKRDGALLEHKGVFGTSYECASHLGNGRGE